MTEQTETLAVRHSLSVAVPLERAFAVFTDRIGTWWPLESRSIGAAPAVTAVLEPREGGRWYERAADGSETPWGRVLAWEPPRRLVLAWEISRDWTHDPDEASEVEVRFSDDGAGGTRVELEHRRLEVYGEQAQQMRAIFGSPDGWGAILAHYAAAAGGAS